MGRIVDVGRDFTAIDRGRDLRVDYASAKNTYDIHWADADRDCREVFRKENPGKAMPATTTTELVPFPSFEEFQRIAKPHFTDLREETSRQIRVDKWLAAQHERARTTYCDLYGFDAQNVPLTDKTVYSLRVN